MNEPTAQNQKEEITPVYMIGDGDPLTKPQISDLLNRLHIPLLGLIEPQPDPIYGHTFRWPW
jgi:hypothetical protein